MRCSPFLKMLLALKRPQRILEVGTAVGFSALLMAEYTSPDCRITTIEKYEKRIPIARRILPLLLSDIRLRFWRGTPWRCCGSFPAPYDFIFMDAAKGQYIHFLPETLRLLEPGGVMISDNVLQEGDIIESHYAVERRNGDLQANEGLSVSADPHRGTGHFRCFPWETGAAVTVKEEEREES